MNAAPLHYWQIAATDSYQLNEESQAIAATHSPDGKLLAIAYGSFGTHDFNNRVVIWDIPKWQKIKTFDGCTKNVNGIAFSKDGKTLICVGGTQQRFMGGEIKIWSTRTWKSVATIEGDDILALRRVATSPLGGVFATGCALSGGGRDKLHLWNAETGELLRTFGDLGNNVSSVRFSPDGKLVAAGVAGQRTASLWSIRDGRMRWSVRAHSEASWLPVAFSPNGKLLATCGDKNIAIWNVANGKSHLILKGHEQDVRAIAFSIDGSLLVSAAWREIRFWDVKTGRDMGSQALPGLNLIEIAVSHGETRLTAVHTINAEITILKFTLERNVRSEEFVRFPEAPSRSRVEQQLIDAVVSNPADDYPRLEYAKWLSERGDARGEFIRSQCARAKLDTTPNLSSKQKAKRARMAKHEDKMLRDHFQSWTAHLAALSLNPGQTEFRRGFLFKLDLCSVDVTDESLKQLKYAPELERLNLDGSNISNKGLKHLRAVTNLRDLRLSETSVSVEALEPLFSLTRLIRVYNYDWGNNRIEAIEALKSQRNKRFKSMSTNEQRAEAIRALEIIVGWLPPDENGNYSRISFSQSWASDADLAYLSAMPETEELDLFECGAITADGLKHLRPLKKLRTLRLSRTGVIDLEPLRHLQSLEDVKADSLEKLDPKSLRHLAKLPKLKRLTLRFCELDDAIMPHIGKLTELCELDLIYNKISEKGKRHLANLKKLVKLEVD